MIRTSLATSYRQNLKCKQTQPKQDILKLIFSALELELYFPDEILGKLLNIFYLILFSVETYSVKKNLAVLLTELLKYKDLTRKHWF